MAAAEGATGAAAGDEIKPYRIHVSSKYIDLTRQKLEITRLPHEVAEPKSQDWWEPKPQVEPLIDFWLEKYSWRDQESTLNAQPQFRTAISVSSSEVPLRIHFLHIRSPHANAIPLLLIPPFPFSNLSMTHMVKLFTDPENAPDHQPFHLVVPSLPGLGFSDALPNNTPVISTTAEMLNTLMTRLAYPHYLVTNTSAATGSPAEIDWKLIDYLASHYSSSCIGAHFISPPLSSPKIYQDPWEWTKWSLASFFHAGILGYSDDDFSALDRASGPSMSVSTTSRRASLTPKQFGLNQLGLREPNTLAYALCDSPTGLLVFVLKGLRLLGPRMNFTPEQLITLTNLAWLPGPENAMRFWAYSSAYDENEEARKKEEGKRAVTAKPKVAITVFMGGRGGPGLVGEAATEEFPQAKLPAAEGGERYACPAWGNARYNVIYSQRMGGKPGLLAWERPEVISAGVRGLVREILKTDDRLKPIGEPVTAPLEQVLVPGEGTTSQPAPAKSPEVAEAKQGEGVKLVNPAPKSGAEDTAAASATGADADGGVFDGASPDTIVVTTPPLGSTP